MKKIAEFKQEHFVFMTDENIVKNFTIPTSCTLYKLVEGFLLVKYIDKIETEKYKHYKEAHKAFTKFVYENLNNE